MSIFARLGAFLAGVTCVLASIEAQGQSLAALPDTATPTSAASATAEPASLRTSVNVSPVGILGYTFRNIGGYALTWVQRVGDRHGVHAEFSVIHVHAKDMYTHLWTFGGSLGYRWHQHLRGDTAFAGVHGVYKWGFGKRLAKLDISQFGAVACGGYRWQWDNGINVAARLGVGYGRYTVTSKQTGPIADEAALASRQALAMVPIEIESELSLGYSF